MSSPSNSISFFPPIPFTVIIAFCRKPILIGSVFALIFLVLTQTIYDIIATKTPTDPTTPTDSNRILNSFEADINQHLTNYYSNVFQDLIYDGFLTLESNTLTVGTKFHQYTKALREIGVTNSKSTKRNVYIPFVNDTFDVAFSSHTGLDCSGNFGIFAKELTRTLKPEGYLIVHTESKDLYSLNSLLDLFDSFKLVRTRNIEVSYWSIPEIREIVLMKQNGIFGRRRNLVGSCAVPAYKKEVIRKAEGLIVEEPVKRNSRKFKYFTSIADISFKTRYIYIDVGARSYGSSIGSWFKKKYPKQNKNFKIFAIEANKKFHQEYMSKKKVTLLPYEAWVRNESLFFEINRAPNTINEEKGIGMGRVQSARTSTSFINDMNKIQGFDFANWVKNSFSEKDFVVVKMDVEGTEFDLIGKMVENGAICLVDEMFVECHYNRWKRSRKYQKGYKDCLELFSSLRERGVLAHQWW